VPELKQKPNSRACSSRIVSGTRRARATQYQAYVEACRRHTKHSRNVPPFLTLHSVDQGASIPADTPSIGSRVVYRVGIFRSVSVGISRYLPYRYRRKTRSVFSVSKIWREPLKKMAGAPFFIRRGGLGPLFVHFALLLKKKRNSRRIFQKKSSRENLKMCSRQSLQYNNTDRKMYLIHQKNDWNQHGMVISNTVTFIE